MEENIMKKSQPYCPVVDINGKISDGKQFDLDITLPEDNRNVIYGVIKDCYKNPVKDAVVKLIEIDFKDGKKKRTPVSHTFTDEFGEFVFGPLCPGKEYAIDIWVDDVRHFKICAKCHHEGKCLRGERMDKCDYMDKDECEHKDKCEYKDEYEHKDKCERKDKYEHEDKYEYEHKDKCEYKDEYEHKDKCERKDKCEHKDKYEYKDEYAHKDKCEYKNKYEHKDKCECKDEDEHKDKCECKDKH